jgi:hypothetical protein
MNGILLNKGENGQWSVQAFDGEAGKGVSLA